MKARKPHKSGKHKHHGGGAGGTKTSYLPSRHTMGGDDNHSSSWKDFYSELVKRSNKEAKAYYEQKHALTNKDD